MCVTTILLTATVNVNFNKAYLYQIDKTSRLESYMKSINLWMRNTSFRIVIVENSGYAFDELQEYRTEEFKNRFELISFKETDIPEAAYLAQNNSKGASEMFAINHAFYKSALLQQSDFIIKVTCRFFVPEFESFLSKYDLNSWDGLSQNDPRRCEIVGSHIKWFHKVFNPYLIDNNGKYNELVESIYYNRLSFLDNVIKSKTFDIESTQRGGLNERFVSL